MIIIIKSCEFIFNIEVENSYQISAIESSDAKLNARSKQFNAISNCAA